jgi:hypothetical protein
MASRPPWIISFALNGVWPAEFDDLESNAPLDRLALLRHPDLAEAALADSFE